jgi:NAD(P)-dependent dehydrogenase (short-subunit alcohol dehydrogenase family)
MLPGAGVWTLWTPLIPATMPPEKVESFGEQTPMGRAAQPAEIAPSYGFFARADRRRTAARLIHPDPDAGFNAPPAGMRAQ